MTVPGAGWQAEAERLGSELSESGRKLAAAEAAAAAAEARVVAAEQRAAAEKVRREDAERRADDHPNTSWGELYADRDRWRRAFLDAATLASIDGVSLVEWRNRALQLDKRIVAIVKLAGTPLATEAAFVPHEMPPSLLHDVQIARKVETATAAAREQKLAHQREAELAAEVQRRVAEELARAGVVVPTPVA